MLAITPIEIPIQVRYVGIKQTMYGTTQLTASTAYQATANARIGFFNDAFLNNYGDMGTYSTDGCTNPVGTPDYNYLSNETNYLPMTGETNGLNTCDNGYRTTGDNANYEMGLTNWTTLNRDYHPDFWNQVTANQYDQILKNLGYRFVLNSSTITSNGSNFDLNLTITNVGYARPFKQRDVYLIMKNTGTNSITTYLLNTDIRTWENSISITQNFNPGIAGTFQLYLWMPDKEPLLSSNSNYSIQLSNNDTWESTTGYNNLLQTISISTLGIEDFFFKNNLSIYPNPSSDFIKIQSNSSEKKEIQIYNSIGQLLKITTISNNDIIDVSGFTNGIYFIRLKNNPSLSLKFIKL
jgi:hypothetical protein